MLKKIGDIKSYQSDVKTAVEVDLPWDNLAGKTLLITGATGLICSTVIDMLLVLNTQRNLNMRILVAGRNHERIRERFGRTREDKDYFFVQYDAITGETPQIDEEEIDYIIHGASNAHPAAYSNQPVETMLANIQGLNALLRLTLDHPKCRLLYLSSSEVYGTKNENLPYEESEYGYVDILNPRASYPSSKRAAETLCASYIAEYGTDVIIVRPGHVYGSTITDSDSRATAQFSRKAVHGEPIVMKSDGSQLRSYCYVLDCATAIFTVLLKGERGNAYNISNSSSIVTIRDMAEAFAEVSGTKVIFECATSEEKKGYNLMKNSSLKSNKLEALGWKGKYGYKEGVRRTVEILKALEASAI